jgi:hypothetical protein
MAWAGPPTVVKTTDGSVYYGELVERVANDHVTIVLATGVTKRFAWKDVDPSPVTLLPRPLVEEPTPGPTDTVRTKNGAVYHGEVVEKVPDDHVTLKLVTGELRRIEQADIDSSPPRPPRSPTGESAPVENVTTKNGSIYHGEIIEKVVGDHVTIRLATGEVKTLDWEDLAMGPAARRPVVAEAREVTLTFTADQPRAALEGYSSTSHAFETICEAPCSETAVSGGRFRIAGAGFVATPSFVLKDRTNDVVASMGRAPLRTASIVLIITSTATFTVGTVLAVAASNAPSYTSAPCPDYPSSGCLAKADNSAITAVAVTVNLLAATLFFTGLALLITSATTVSVNDHRVAHRAGVGPDGIHF